MKKIYTIFILSFLLIGCSENDSEIIEIQNPTIENISNNTASVGDIISINGKNFNPNENYLIHFNNVEGEIIEITSNLIRVQIPENATTGNITFTFNNQTTIIGELTIDASTESSLKLYATKDFPGYTNSTPTKFIEINHTNGNETDLFDLETNQIVGSLVFDKQNGKIIGVSSLTDENDKITNQLFIIDISRNTFNSINLNDDVYYELSLSNDGKLFAIKDFPGYSNSTPTKFKEIDPSNGNETELLDLDTNQLVESLVFDEQNSKVVGVSYTEDENDNITSQLFIIDISANTFNSINLSDDVYYELSLSNEGKLFAIKDFPGYLNSTPTKFIEIDPSNGNETDLLDLDTNQFVESLVFDEQNNKVIGVSYTENESGNITNRLFIVDISTNTFNSINLSDDVYYELGYSN